MSEHEHTRVDHGADQVDPQTATEPGPSVLAKVPPRSDKMAGNKIECDACPVLCQITEGRTGACDRYGNVGGVLTRVDPVVLLKRLASEAEPAATAGAGTPGSPAATDASGDGHVMGGGAVAQPQSRAVRFATEAGEQAPLVRGEDLFVTGIGATTTYPDYKPAPFIVSAPMRGVDMVTVVTEGIFSYCSMKVKIDTDRWLGPEQANVRSKGEIVGHVTTAEYGSQMLSLGGVHHLTGGSKKEGRVTCDLMMALGNRDEVELSIDGGARLRIRAGAAPVVDEVEESRMRVGCGSATIGIFAKQWYGHADEVVVVDDHITGVLTEHQAGRCLDMRLSGLRIRGRKSTPGRYFQVANPGTGWGGTDIQDPLSIVEGFDPALAWPGLRLLMVSTTGEHWAYFTLDQDLVPRPAEITAPLATVVERIGENCEPSLVSVLFLGGAGGSLRAGVTENPVRLTRSIKDLLVNVTCGGAPAYVWPGGGITVMVDVMRMPANAFGSVPTPAIVAPIEFTMRASDYAALGGYVDAVLPLEQALARARTRTIAQDVHNPWPIGRAPMLG